MDKRIHRRPQGVRFRFRRFSRAGTAVAGLGIAAALAVHAHHFVGVSEGSVVKSDKTHAPAPARGTERARQHASLGSDARPAPVRQDHGDRQDIPSSAFIGGAGRQAAVISTTDGLFLVDPSGLAQQRATLRLPKGIERVTDALLMPAGRVAMRLEAASLPLSNDLDKRFAWAHASGTFGTVSGSIPGPATRMANASLPMAFPAPMPGARLTTMAKARVVASLDVETAAIDRPDGADTPERVDAPKRFAALDVVPRPRPSRPIARVNVKPSAATTLAYASPEASADEEAPSNIFGKLFRSNSQAKLPSSGSRVAVYVIDSATVHMPDGERLEAHSGLAHMQDNPRYAHKKNSGPTPPNVYNLVMRERRFHGVEAIRLLPADGRKKFNRDGLLAHTYMYRVGDRSQSNGCVVFKRYDRFLTAFKQGKITRLIVVGSMDELPTYMAAL